MRNLTLVMLGLLVERVLASIKHDRRISQSMSNPATAPTALNRTTDEAIRLRDLQLKEAEWVWAEMEDFVKLIQRYRGLFITAVFAAVGWLLGQALNSGGFTSVNTPDTLMALRRRPDIAAVLCIVPILATLFVVLMLEAQFQIQSLARYRYLLGIVLGEGKPVWRWELWKEVPEGSVRAWTNPSNVYFGLAALILTSGALWFPWPALAVAASPMLSVFWWSALTITVSFVVLAIVLGVRNIRANRVARALSKDLWDQLWRDPTARSGRRSGNE